MNGHVWNSLQLSWQSITVLAVCNFLGSQKLSWQYATVLALCNCHDSIQLFDSMQLLWPFLIVSIGNGWCQIEPCLLYLLSFTYNHQENKKRSKRKRKKNQKSSEEDSGSSGLSRENSGLISREVSSASERAVNLDRMTGLVHAQQSTSYRAALICRPGRSQGVLYTPCCYW